jgi:C-terminal processing protease CtpA/Prc
VIDGKAGWVYAHPRIEPPPPYEYNRLGAVFVPKSEQDDDLVAYVAAGSPAAIAGIRNGDLLLKIDELDVTKWRTQPGILPLSQFWEKPAGTGFVLTLKRGDATITVPVTLKNILGF